MAKTVPVKNDKIPKKYRRHGQSRKWLEDYFPANSCAYCWVFFENTDIDHYLPVTMAPHLKLEPNNHLLSCISCNRFLKRDYHPQHLSRKYYKDEKSGAHIHDPRRTDVKQFYKVNTDGTVNVIHKTAKNNRWAHWNISFFALNKRKNVLNKRRAIMKALDQIEIIRAEWYIIKTYPQKHRALILQQFIDSYRLLNKNKLFLRLFEL